MFRVIVSLPLFIFPHPYRNLCLEEILISLILQSYLLSRQWNRIYVLFCSNSNFITCGLYLYGQKFTHQLKTIIMLLTSALSDNSTFIKLTSSTIISKHFNKHTFALVFLFSRPVWIDIFFLMPSTHIQLNCRTGFKMLGVISNH